MKILVIGSGAREHAICNNLIKNEKVSKVYCAPGNAGTAKEKNCENVKISSQRAGEYRGRGEKKVKKGEKV